MAVNSLRVQVPHAGLPASDCGGHVGSKDLGWFRTWGPDC